MLSQSPDELPSVLFVDDEPKTCKHFARLFAPRFRIITAPDGVEAMKLFQDHIDDIGIIMTDQRMPNQTGTEFLEKASRLNRRSNGFSPRPTLMSMPPSTPSTMGGFTATSPNPGRSRNLK